MDFSYGGLINAWFTLYILASPFWWPKQIRLVRNQTKLRYVIRMVCFDYSTFLYLDDPRVFDSLRRIEKKKVLLKINVSLVHMVISIDMLSVISLSLFLSQDYNVPISYIYRIRCSIQCNKILLSVWQRISLKFSSNC